MASNLKLAISELDIQSLAYSLVHDNLDVRLNAFSNIDSSNIDELLEIVKICAYDYRPAVRAASYRALKFADPAKITTVIKDAVRDIDKNAFSAARELMHNSF